MADHGGEVRFDSDAARGTTVTLSLPAAPAEIELPAAALAPPGH